MLKISLDEAYVFDLLSIYEVKLYNSIGLDREKILKSLITLSDEIKLQIGNEKYGEIIKSIDYMELKFANEKVFKLVDRADESELSKLTADTNYERFIKKSKLQQKFFGDNITEVKI